MIYDVLSAFSLGLFALCSLNLYFAYKIQVLHVIEDGPWEREKRLFIVGMTNVCVWAVIQSLGYLLWDLDIISKIMQYKLSIIGRPFAFYGFFIFFRILSLGLPQPTQTRIMWGGILLMCLWYCYKVVT